MLNSMKKEKNFEVPKYFNMYFVSALTKLDHIIVTKENLNEYFQTVKILIHSSLYTRI